MTTIATQMSDDMEARGGFLALMRHRNYAWLWSAQLISLIGDRFHWVAISLWVFAQTGSALSVSYAIMALLIAPALVGFYAGVLVDRMDRRRIMVAADLVRAGLVAAIPWLMEQGIGWVYLDLFLISSASAFFRPAMFAAIPQSVPKARLLQANAFFASMDSSTEVFGPALAGLVVGSLGYAAAMYVDAASYLISAVFIAMLRLDRVEPSGAETARRSQSAAAPVVGARGVVLPARAYLSAVAQQGGILHSLREGLRYIRGDRIQVALVALLVGGFWVAGLNSLQTPLAKGVLGVTDRQFGWFQSVWGMGFIAASLLLAWFGGRFPKGQAIVFGYLLWAVAAGATGLSPNYGMLIVSGFWVGFANMLVFVNVATLMMEHTPEDMMGRVVTARQILVALIRVAALLGFGALADLFGPQTGPRAAILAMAGISLVGTFVAAARFPVLWRYRIPIQPRVGETAPVTAVAEGLAHRIAPFGAIIRVLIDRTDPEFDPAEQRWLNAATLLIVGVGWLVLLMVQPPQAFGIAAAVAVSILIAHLVRVMAGRLWPSAGGHETGGAGQASPGQEEEKLGRRRIP
ncbi:MAG: MFS transporter [Armatimonadota bacterium]|nr:MFS transporter [Armatimonadota bacterium]